MRHTRVPGLKRAVALGIVGLFVACTFPSVQYGPADGGPAEGGLDATQHDGASSSGSSGGDGGNASGGEGGDEGGLADGTSSGGDDSSGSSSGDDSGLSDVAIQDAVDDYVFEAAPDAPVCDEDQDKDPKPGASCGGGDCDDDDPRAYTGEPNYLTYAPTLVTNGDWDCNGVVEPEYATKFTCGALNTGQCAGASGFKDTPGCGATSANFITCKVSAGVLCIVDTTSSKTQGCK